VGFDHPSNVLLP